MLFIGDKKFVVALIIVMAFIASLIGVSDRKEDVVEKEITVSYIERAADTSLLISIAEEQGYFNGVKVRRKPTEKNPLANLQSGEADLVVQPVDQAALAYLKGDNTVALAAFYSYPPSLDIISKSQDLNRAEKVGVTRVGGAEQIAFSVATEIDTNRKYLQIEKDTAKLAALLSGDVDTAFIKWSYLPDEEIQNLRSGGYTLFSSSDVFRDIPLFTALITKEDLFSANRSAYQEFLKGIARSAKYIRDNPSEIKRRLVSDYKINPSMVDGYYDRALVAMNDRNNFQMDDGSFRGFFENLRKINNGSGEVDGFIRPLN